MRILLIHSGADLYGASRSLLRLTTRLRRDGNTVKVILPDDGPLKHSLELAGVEVHINRGLPIVTRQKSKSIFGWLSLCVEIPISIIRICASAMRFRPDIIHTNTALILSPGLVAKILNVPHVWHIRESFLEFPTFFKYYQWYISTLSGRIICVSTPIKEQFHKRIQDRNIVVIHNGFPREEFREVDASRINKFKRKFGFDHHTLVGLVGRIKFGRKGQEVLVRAAALLKTKFPDVRFVFVGSPYPGNEDHLANLERLIDQLGVRQNVVLTGDVEDIQAVHSALDVSVLASALPEPFGGVVVESMAFGKPVVGTRIGGTIEQIEHGVTGLLIPPQDPNALADALEHLLSDADERHRMGQNGYKRYMEKFEFELFYSKMHDIYSQLAIRN